MAQARNLHAHVLALDFALETLTLFPELAPELLLEHVEVALFVG